MLENFSSCSPIQGLLESLIWYGDNRMSTLHLVSVASHFRVSLSLIQTGWSLALWPASIQHKVSKVSQNFLASRHRFQSSSIWLSTTEPLENAKIFFGAFSNEVAWLQVPLLVLLPKSTTIDGSYVSSIFWNNFSKCKAALPLAVKS